MRTAIFSTRPYDRVALHAANAPPQGPGHELVYYEPTLGHQTVALARGFPAVCLFVNDLADASVLTELHAGGTRLIALRSAGFNHVDLRTADRLGITVLRVPAYSPHAVAEHAVALLLCLNRKIHRAFNRVREQNFHLEGLMGFDLVGKTVGIVGTGKTGSVFARIMRGFGCNVIAHDLAVNQECAALGVEFVGLNEVLERSDVLSLHCPLTPKTRHLIDAEALQRCRRGVVIVNTSRGAVIDTKAVIHALKSGHLGGLAIDVYEEEGDIFFRDLSEQVISDDVFARLTTFPNVIITGHQAFFTREAVGQIAATTVENLSDFERGEPRGDRRVTAAQIVG